MVDVARLDNLRCALTAARTIEFRECWLYGEKFAKILFWALKQGHRPQAENKSGFKHRGLHWI